MRRCSAISYLHLQGGDIMRCSCVCLVVLGTATLSFLSACIEGASHAPEDRGEELVAGVAATAIDIPVTVHGTVRNSRGTGACGQLAELRYTPSPFEIGNLSTFMGLLDGASTGGRLVSSVEQNIPVMDYSIRCGGHRTASNGHYVQSTQPWPALRATGASGAARFRGYLLIREGEPLDRTIGLIGNDSLRLRIQGQEIVTVNWADGQWKKFRHITFPSPGLYSVEVEWATNLACYYDPFELIWAEGHVPGYGNHDTMCNYHACSIAYGRPIPGFTVIDGDDLAKSPSGDDIVCQQCNNDSDCASDQVCNSAGICDLPVIADGDEDGVLAENDCNDEDPAVGALLYENDFSSDDGWLAPTAQRPGPWRWDGETTYVERGGQQVQIGAAQGWSDVVVHARLTARGTESACGHGGRPCGEHERWRGGVVVRAALDSDQDEGFHGYRCALASNATNGCFEEGLFLQLAEFMDQAEDDIASECDGGCPENTTFDQIDRQNHDLIDLSAGDAGEITFYAVADQLHCEARSDSGEAVTVTGRDSSFATGTIGLSTLNLYGEFDSIRVCEAFAVPR